MCADPHGRGLVGSLDLRVGCRILVLLLRGGVLLMRDIRHSVLYRLLGYALIWLFYISKERKGREGKGMGWDVEYRPRTGSGFFGGGGT